MCGKEFELDSMEHYVQSCEETYALFDELGESEEKKWERLWDDSLVEMKGRILRKIWKERESRTKRT